MPLAAFTKSNAQTPLTPNVPATAKGTVVTVVSDAEATAANSTELKAPLGYAGSNCRWVALGDNGGKVAFRVKYTGTVTTSPVIQVYGVYTNSSPTSDAFANDGTFAPNRLDNSASASGITLTLDATNDIRDAAGTPNLYSPWYTFISPVTAVPGDALGVNWLLVLCSTAANVSGSASIEMLILN
jgi:hypothetical protein